MWIFHIFKFTKYVKNRFFKSLSLISLDMSHLVWIIAFETSKIPLISLSIPPLHNFTWNLALIYAIRYCCRLHAPLTLRLIVIRIKNRCDNYVLWAKRRPFLLFFFFLPYFFFFFCVIRKQMESEERAVELKRLWVIFFYIKFNFWLWFYNFFNLGRISQGEGHKHVIFLFFP